MRSIKKNEQKSDKNGLQQMLNQSLWYSRCCILSVSLMSGFGIPWNYDEARVDSWVNLSGMNRGKGLTVENPSILRAIYKKGEPRYVNTYNGTENDCRNFMWDDSSFKKVISPAGQSCLIMDEIMLSKYFQKCAPSSSNTDKDCCSVEYSALLLKSAELQTQFMSDFLRNSDGLFVSKADLSLNPFGDPYLEEPDEAPNVTDQAYALSAFSMMAYALKDVSHTELYGTLSSETYKRYASEIYEVFRDSPEDIFEGKTRDLCNVILACIEYYRLCKSSEVPQSGVPRSEGPQNEGPQSEGPHSEVLQYIIMLSVELESRIDMSGNLLRLPFDDKLTSNTSCFNAINSLIKSYRLTGIKKFQAAASLLYDKLDLLWNCEHCLYSLDDDDKYRYTSRDVGSVLSGLNSIRLFGEQPYMKDAEEKLVSFFNSAVNSSKLIHSTLSIPADDALEWRYAQKRFDRGELSRDFFSYQEIPVSIEVNVAPVFAKKFTFKPKKRKYEINSSSFYSEYSLYAAGEMLQISYPDIDCFYTGE